MKISRSLFAAVAASSFLPTGFCSAAMLIQDNFNRTGALNGAAPTADLLAPSSTWIAPSSYSTDGTSANNYASAGDVSGSVAAIPFDLAAFASAHPSTLLSLSVTANVANPNSSGSWISLGFEQGTGDFPFKDSVAAGPWMILRADSGTVEFPGPGTNGAPAASTPDGATTFSNGTLTLTYDTKDNVASFYLDTGSGPVLEGTTTYASIPADQYVGFSTEADNFFGNTSASFTSFSLAAVPEPTSVGTLGLGATAMLAARRRRRGV